MTRPASILTDPKVSARLDELVASAPPLTQRQVKVITRVMTQAADRSDHIERRAA